MSALTLHGRRLAALNATLFRVAEAEHEVENNGDTEYRPSENICPEITQIEAGDLVDKKMGF